MAWMTRDLAEQGLRGLLQHRKLQKFTEDSFVFLEEQGCEYLHEVLQVFELLAKNLTMKAMEKERYRVLLEQTVAMSPEALVGGSTASPTQLQGTVERVVERVVKEEGECVVQQEVERVVERVVDAAARSGRAPVKQEVERVVEEEQTVARPLAKVTRLFAGRLAS